MLGVKSACTFSVLWPTALGVRVRGEQPDDDSKKSSMLEDAVSTIDYDEFLDAATSGSLQKINEFLLYPDLDVNYGDTNGRVTFETYGRRESLSSTGGQTAAKVQYSLAAV